MADRTPLLLLVLCVGFTVSREVHVQKRVVGGQPCHPDERQYHVKLITLGLDGTWGFCGGSLLTDRWILTASHCWEQGRTIYAVVGVHPGPGQRVEILSEPRIYRDNNNNMHDIMLLKLPYPTNIQPVTHPDCTHPPRLQDIVNVAGHGSTTAGLFHQRLPGHTAPLHCGNLNVVDCTNLQNNVKNTYPLFWNYIRYQFVFCGFSPTVDVCKGDSGGGVVFNNRIYGVISFGNPTAACKDGGGFINICQHEYSVWIDQTINIP